MLPSALKRMPITTDMLLECMYLSNEGLYGIPTSVATGTIFGFIMFGAFLERSNMTNIFMDIACLLTKNSQGGPAKVAIFAGGMSNDTVIALVQAYPDRFLGFAGLNPLNWRWSIGEIHRTVVDGPLKGVVLEPGAVRPAMYGDDALLYPVYAECEKHDIPVMVMLGGNAGPNVDYSFPRVIHKIASDFPSVDFIVSHGGWPWVQAVLGVCFVQQNVYLSPDLYMFNQPGWQDYVTAAHTYMQDRILYASAYPFLPLECVHQFKAMFREDVLPKLLYRNAAKLLKLDI